MNRAQIMRLILAERDRQDRLFPDQHLPMVLSVGDQFMYQSMASSIREKNDAALKLGTGLSWMSILMEELYEAGGAITSADIAEELTQLAALCVRAIEDIQRQWRMLSVNDGG